MRVFAICLTLAATALAGCSAPPTTETEASTTPVSAVAAPPTSQAAPQPPSTQASLASPAADDNEVVCRNEKPLGTRIGKRVCKTRAQLRLEEESARRMMNNRDKKSHGVTDASTTGT